MLTSAMAIIGGCGLARVRALATSGRFARGRAHVADLCDVHVGDVSNLSDGTPHTHGVRVLAFAPPLCFHDYGGLTQFQGLIETVVARDSNPSVRAILTGPGYGRVLVIDGLGSNRCALFGDQLGKLAVLNGWAGIIVNGTVRDSAALRLTQLGVKAIGTNPVKSHKGEPGLIGEPVTFGGVTFRSGEWLAADEDGVIISPTLLGPP
ncbi:ribonuclease E inhibitor RraA/Dimethylmenaquinone methyltransferase [Pavlovales sp. CCMP2436]|nr:ribonuclease E inhibitor RraA/Dimethylmenaquinone methyltransferase [Pavlovales sp. CCMP2436]